jgi:hypothetical protein
MLQRTNTQGTLSQPLGAPWGGHLRKTQREHRAQATFNKGTSLHDVLYKRHNPCNVAFYWITLNKRVEITICMREGIVYVTVDDWELEILFRILSNKCLYPLPVLN